MDSANVSSGPVTYPSPEYAAWSKAMVETRQAAFRDKDGRLPGKATHPIIRIDDQGVAIIGPRERTF